MAKTFKLRVTTDAKFVIPTEEVNALAEQAALAAAKGAVLPVTGIEPLDKLFTDRMNAGNIDGAIELVVRHGARQHIKDMWEESGVTSFSPANVVFVTEEKQDV